MRDQRADPGESGPARCLGSDAGLPVGAENSVTLCDLQILVEKAAEAFELGDDSAASVGRCFAGRGRGRRVGAENSVTLCDLQILVYENSESISSQRPNGRSGRQGSAARGRVLIE